MSNREPLDTGTDDLLGWVEDGVAVLSFNRPEARNALSAPMYGGFATVLPQVEERSDIGCLVVTGEGGAFCAGGDVKGFAARNAGASEGPAPVEGAVDDLRRRQREVSLALHLLPKTTIAAIPGAAAGAGLSIALACDLRVASARAVITTAFSKIGASGDFGGSWFLTQLVGPSRAKQLYLMSERLSAAEAERLGIVNLVAEDDAVRVDLDGPGPARSRPARRSPTGTSRRTSTAPPPAPTWPPASTPRRRRWSRRCVPPITGRPHPRSSRSGHQRSAARDDDEDVRDRRTAGRARRLRRDAAARSRCEGSTARPRRGRRRAPPGRRRRRQPHRHRPVLRPERLQRADPRGAAPVPRRPRHRVQGRRADATRPAAGTPHRHRPNCAPASRTTCAPSASTSSER